jgi:hypothetical protein
LQKSAGRVRDARPYLIPHAASGRAESNHCAGFTVGRLHFRSPLSMKATLLATELSSPRDSSVHPDKVPERVVDIS